MWLSTSFRFLLAHDNAHILFNDSYYLCKKFNFSSEIETLSIHLFIHFQFSHSWTAVQNNCVYSYVLEPRMNVDAEPSDPFVKKGVFLLLHFRLPA